MTPRRALMVVLLFTLPLVTAKIRGADEIQYFSYLRSLAFDRDLEFGNEYAYFHARDPQGLAGFKATFLDLREPLSGRHINFAPLGSALLWSPFYGVAHLGVLLARGLGSEVAADGFSTPYVAAACYASWLYGVLGLLLIYDGLVRYGAFSERIAALAVGGLALASPALYYLSLAPAFSHATSLCVVALLLWLSLRAHAQDETAPAARLLDWALLGFVGGLAALVREQDGLFLVVPGLLLIRTSLRARKPQWILLRGLALGGCALATFALQLFAYRAVNGRFGPSLLVSRKMKWASPHFWEVLIDPGHGLFVWAPVLLLAAAGLVWLWATRRQALFGALFAGLLLQVWINGAVDSWTQAGAFGSRRFVGATVLFAWGLAGLLAAVVPRIGLTACAVVLGALVWWNVSLMVQFGLKLMDRQRLEWPRVAVNQVTAVPPRLFRVGWLFLTDRESLLREGP